MWDNDILYLKGSYMPLCTEYYIVQMSTAASHGGTDPSDPIFNDNAALIRLTFG